MKQGLFSSIDNFLKNIDVFFIQIDKVLRIETFPIKFSHLRSKILLLFVMYFLTKFGQSLIFNKNWVDFIIAILD